jgi:ribonucleoside-diphosphate reductase alpha chain
MYPPPHVASVQIQEDNVAGIYRTVQQCAEISSEAGGIGIAVHKVRARGSYILMCS